uniref:Putative glycoprotein n=1 Tax=Camellia chlorotic ringspot virus TaxID=2802541 RepID=A0A6G6C203_9VIRU|nr:putative glycoprotein [Camellia chlorotic ringspot virus]
MEYKLLCVITVLLLAFAVFAEVIDINSLLKSKKTLRKLGDVSYEVGSMNYNIKPVQNNCLTHFEVIDNDIVLCTSDKIQTSMIKTDNGCYRTDNEIFVYNCNNQSRFRVKPKLNYCQMYSNNLCSIITFLEKILKLVSAVVITKILKPLIILFLNLFSKKLGKKFCESCNINYLLIHDECNVRASKSTVNNLIFYVIVFLNMTVAANSLELNKLYTEKVGENMTKLRIIDEDNVIQTFSENGNNIELVVRSSLVEYHCHYSHDILEVSKTFIKDDITVCNEEKKCLIYADKPGYFQYKMLKDKFKCVFSQATHCGNCDVQTNLIGSVYRCDSSSPLIEIEFKINHKKYTEMISTTNRISKSKNNFAYDPIEYNSEPVMLYKDLDNSFYTGDICNSPDNSCFGDLISKDGKVNYNYDPKMFERDGEFFLESCIRKNNVNKNNLILTKIQYDNTSKKYVKDYNFGLINGYIDGSYFLNSNDCELRAKIDEIMINGCYDCLNGFMMTIKLKKNQNKTSCSKVICIINDVNRNFNIIDQDELNMRLYSSEKSVNVNCNGYKRSYILNNSGSYNDFIIHKQLKSSNNPIREDIFGFLKFEFISLRTKFIMLSVLFIILSIPFISFIIYFRRIFSHLKKSHKHQYVEVECKSSTGDRFHILKDVVV